MLQCVAFIQVTANAQSKKIKDTVSKWIALNKGHYKLIIVGITSKVRSKKATIYTLSELIGEAKNLDLKDLEQLLNALKSRISPHTYSLTTDAASINNLIDYLDRGALRHLQDQEGDYRRMYASLEEVKKFIFSGSLEGYPISIKPLSMYGDNTKTTLREIEHRITDILSICDRHRTMSGVIAICKREFDQIDELKTQILKLVAKLKSINQLNRAQQPKI